VDPAGSEALLRAGAAPYVCASTFGAFSYHSLMTEQRKIRVVIAKPGLDGHDRGAKVIARALRDAGMEVIYTGLRQSPEQIVGAAAQEDADVIGLSILSGAHLAICRRVVELLRQRGMDGVRVFIGGIIPAQDIAELQKMGISDVFLPGASTQDVIRAIQAAAATIA
jgi:methylmalonyl-CoA mutase, C-terminal domain